MAGEAIDFGDGGEVCPDLLDEAAHGADRLVLEEQHEGGAARMRRYDGGGHVLADDGTDTAQYSASDGRPVELRDGGEFRDDEHDSPSRPKISVP